MLGLTVLKTTIPDWRVDRGPASVNSDSKIPWGFYSGRCGSRVVQARPHWVAHGESGETVTVMLQDVVVSSPGPYSESWLCWELE